MKRIGSVVLGVFVSVASGIAHADTTPAQKCVSTKLKATGTKANGKLKCWSKEVVKPSGLAACTDKVEAKFASKFAAAEAQGGCATTGDAGTIEATVDGLVDDVVRALAGSPPGTRLGTDDAKRCGSAKMRAAGKKTLSKTKCYARAATAGTLDALCLSAAAARFSRKWSAAETKGGCATSGDEDGIESTVDAFVKEIVDKLPSTTTTTSTTTSTTTTTWPHGTTTGITIQSGGLTRSYNVHIPPGYDGTVAVPLVLDLHGSGTSAAIQEAVSGFRALADANGFVMAYPSGEFQQWNAGVCCDPAASAGVDDVGFARDLVADVASKANIDPLRVYATGLSNGGAMAHRLACEAADVFAAAAPVAFPLALDPLTVCQPVRPISVLHFAGLTDEIIPYDGGVATSPVTGQMFVVPSAPASFAYWASANGCSDGPPDIVEDLGNGASCDTYTPCASGVAVGLCSIHGTAFNGHFLYANSDGVNVAQRAWDFMSAFTLAP